MSILLDTVTVSAFREPDRSDPSVLRWESSQRNTQFHLSVISLNEIHFGIRKVGHRDPSFAQTLTVWYENLISNSLDLPLIMVNPAIARVAADFRYEFKMSYNDAIIGATASIYRLTLATRNVKDFQDCGIELVNPWDFES